MCKAFIGLAIGLVVCFVTAVASMVLTMRDDYNDLAEREKPPRNADSDDTSRR